MEIQTSRPKPMPRGLRNNNPLNIENNPKSTWVGQCGQDGRFCQFENLAYGYRAACRIMYTYRQKYGLCSIRQIISRWAPAVENNTDAYVREVCKRMRVEPNYVVLFGSKWEDDKHWCCELLHAMACVENGVPWEDIKETPIREGYNMAFGIF